MRFRTGSAALVAAVALITGVAAPATALPMTAGSADLREATEQALAEAALTTQNQGITTYAVVLSRATGRTLAATENATTPVASESLVKLLIAAWYLVEADGAPSADLSALLTQMITASDDDIASAIFAEGQVTAMAQRYGMTDTTEPADGRWGSTAVTAADLARFLWSASRDPLVGPWLLDAMGGIADTAADGWDQVYGVNALPDSLGAKQGWGSDNWHSGQPNAVHSLGFTDDLVVVDLQTGVEGTYWTMAATATDTVAAVAAATERPDRFEGAIDSVSVEGNRIRVVGWVDDTTSPGTAAPIRVTATRSTDAALDPPVTGSGSARLARAEVGDHGFDYGLAVAAPGRYEVCVTVRSAVGDKAIALVGCGTVTVA